MTGHSSEAAAVWLAIPCASLYLKIVFLGFGLGSNDMQKAHLRILAVELVLEPDTQAQGDVKQITFQRNDNFQRHCDMRTASSLRHILTSSRSNNSEAGGPLSQDPTAFSGSPGSRESSPFGIAELQEVRLRFGDTATELPSLTEVYSREIACAALLLAPWGASKVKSLCGEVRLDSRAMQPTVEVPKRFGCKF